MNSRSCRKAIFAVMMVMMAPAVRATNLPGGTITISHVTLEGDRVFISGIGGTNPEGCTNPSIVILAAAPELRDRYLWVAMTALASGLKIDLWVQGCGGTSWGTAPIAYFLSLHR